MRTVVDTEDAVEAWVAGERFRAWGRVPEGAMRRECSDAYHLSGQRR